MIFGNWRPGGMAAGAGLFGYTGGVQVYDADGSAMHALLLIIAIALAVVAFFQIRGGHMAVGGGRRDAGDPVGHLVPVHRPAAPGVGHRPRRTW